MRIESTTSKKRPRWIKNNKSFWCKSIQSTKVHNLRKKWLSFLFFSFFVLFFDFSFLFFFSSCLMYQCTGLQHLWPQNWGRSGTGLTLTESYARMRQTVLSKKKNTDSNRKVRTRRWYSLIFNFTFEGYVERQGLRILQKLHLIQHKDPMAEQSLQLVSLSWERCRVFSRSLIHAKYVDWCLWQALAWRGHARTCISRWNKSFVKQYVQLSSGATWLNSEEGQYKSRTAQTTSQAYPKRQFRLQKGKQSNLSTWADLPALSIELSCEHELLQYSAPEALWAQPIKYVLLNPNRSPNQVAK